MIKSVLGDVTLLIDQVLRDLEKNTKCTCASWFLLEALEGIDFLAFPGF